MQKTLLIIIAVILQLQHSTAQQLVKTDFDYVSRKIIFPPLIQQLTKDDKYAVMMPKKLTYHSKQYDIINNIWNPFNAFISIKAKVHLLKPDYIFKISTEGVSHLDSQAVRFIKTKRYENNVSKEANGLVRDYTCNFPCQLIVMNKDSQVIRTIEIAGEKEVFTITLHKDFLAPTELPINPFFSELSLTDFESFNKDMKTPVNIYRKIEEKIGYQVFSRVSKAICHLYNSYDSNREIYGFGFVKPKDRPFDYSDMDNALAQYKTALDSMHNGNLEACKTLCLFAKAVFEKLLQSNEARIDKNVKETLFYNLSHVNLLTQNFEEAWKYYQLILPGYESSRLEIELRSRIIMHETYFKLKAQISN